MSLSSVEKQNNMKISPKHKKYAYQFACSNKSNCYCMNCQIPYENWVAIGKHLYNQNLDTLCNNIDVDTTDTTDTTNASEAIEQLDINNLHCDENFVFKKTFFFNKTMYLYDYIDNIEKNILPSFKCNLIYKNNEISMYNIVDTEYYLTNLLIHINTLLEITKIEIISDFRSQFVKSNIYEKLILF